MSAIAIPTLKPEQVLSYYGLTEPPFSLSPSPRFFWASSQHRACLVKTRYMIDSRQGLVTIIADVGHGKTTVLRYLYDQLITDETNEVAMIVHPNFPSTMQLLKAVCAEFDVPNRRSAQEQLKALNERLVKSFTAGRNVILLIDEAQLLTGKHLELIRQFLNFETHDEKFFQVVLAGQLELKTTLRKKTSLLSRVAISSTLDALTFEDLSEMINFRLMVAGRKEPLFTDEAKGLVYQASMGIPRNAVKLCHTSLVLGMMSRVSEIDAEIVSRAADHSTGATDEQENR
jgi:general secretion pathway protein A